ALPSAATAVVGAVSPADVGEASGTNCAISVSAPRSPSPAPDSRSRVRSPSERPALQDGVRRLRFQTMNREVDDLRIDPQDAARRVATGEAFLLDVVTEGSWRSLPRVSKGALRFPPEDLIARLDEIPRDRAATAFCT